MLLLFGSLISAIMLKELKEKLFLFKTTYSYLSCLLRELQQCANILSISAFRSVSDFTTLACPFVLFVQVEVNHASEIDAIFDSISYDKGASVIRMLQSYLGAERFQV